MREEPGQRRGHPKSSAPRTRASNSARVALRRQPIILALLQVGPASAATLQAAVEAAVGAKADEAGAQRAVRSDLGQLAALAYAAAYQRGKRLCTSGVRALEKWEG